MTVADAVGPQLATHRIDHVFGVIGSDNFHVTNALVAAGARSSPRRTRAAPPAWPTRTPARPAG